MENINPVTNENNQNNNGSTRKSLLILAVIGFVVAAVIISMYVYMSSGRVYVEKSQIIAQPIELSAQNGGILEKLMVSEGDQVSANTPVAQVGQEIVKTKEAGIITLVNDNIGKTFTPGEAVVTMVSPDDLRVIAQTEEDKGLSQIEVGQRVIFTVDAFDGKKFSGIVDEVSPAARQGDVVFNISSQRQENEFNVKIRFDQAQYPELKNGMSAKAWIYKD
jgi:multidrug resistance efflux pump